MRAISKCKKKKIYHKNFGAYLLESMKVLRDDIVITIFFTISSSSIPIFSVKNGAVWVLLWYIISFLRLVGGCYYDYCDNEEGIRKKKWHHRHGFDETMTEKQKNEIKWFKKADIERGGWRFLVLKVSTALLLAVVMMGISFILQFVISSNNYENEKMFFIGVFIDTLVITVVEGYYRSIIEAAFSVKGIKNKIYAILNVFGRTTLENIFLHLILVVFLGCALVCCFNEFSLYAPFVLGILYICNFFVNPVKDVTERQ